MARIHGRADVEIRIYRNRVGTGYSVFARSEQSSVVKVAVTPGVVDEQGLWLLVDAITAEMESWLF